MCAAYLPAGLLDGGKLREAPENREIFPGCFSPQKERGFGVVEGEKTEGRSPPVLYVAQTGPTDEYDPKSINSISCSERASLCSE